MTPEIATTAAVISVAAAITRAHAPRVHAERARLLVAQRQHVDAPAQEPERDQADEHSGQDRPARRGGDGARLPSSQNVIAGSWL